MNPANSFAANSFAINGLASLLDETHTRWVENIWQALAERCQLLDVRTELPPHFTWQVVERYDVEKLEPVVRSLAWATPPFSVRTSGLGIFTGRNPVLYIHIVKDALLMRLHEQIWQRSACCAIRPSPYYNLQNWTPHITLAADNVRPAELHCALELLALEPLNWEIPINNLVLLRPVAGTHTPEIVRFDLTGRHAS
jgi:2'-5' RNA ligase